MSNPIFSLDIGTRSVVGTILEETNGHYEVLDLISLEHEERSMIDGQIHNILNVSKVIETIKQQLSDKYGALRQVSVAAAGRALATEEGILTLELANEKIASTEDLHRLELAAVQKAQETLIEKSALPNQQTYYCVGYSVLQYTLDDQVIGNLIDQVGKQAQIHVIATFLPQVVVESLLAALKHADLEMTALTLEPIAAINVLVPPSMRKLNIALVDIGAGTSDIALANDGTITAYGMVPLAGDEVTEALSQAYLVDFPIAEEVKKQLHTNDFVEIEDILGFQQQFSTEEVYAEIEPTVTKIATTIGQEIMRLNNNEAPKAVILVGGGSLTPKLAKSLSEALNLPETRVGIRGLEALSNVTVSKEFGQSPELVTPIGIAIAAKNSPLNYMTVTVNEQTVRMFELKEMTVGDALLISNFSMEEMYGKPGRGMTITYNNKTLAIPGEMGRMSVIHLNGERVTIKEVIKSGDVITIIPGENGQEAKVTVAELIDEVTPIDITVNGEELTIQPQVMVNGNEVPLTHQVRDRDRLTVFYLKTVEDTLKIVNNTVQSPNFTLKIDGQTIRLKSNEASYRVNGQQVPLHYELQQADQLTLEPVTIPSFQSIASQLNLTLKNEIPIYFNGEAIHLKRATYEFYKNGELCSAETTIDRNDRIEWKSIPHNPFVFSDVFRHTDYQLPTHANGTYQLLKNGVATELTAVLAPGDRLEIAFHND